MEDAEIEKYTVAGVGTLYIKNELFVSCVTDEDGYKPFMDWARDNAPVLISETIHHQRLKSWSKERLEQGQPHPDNMIKATFVPTAMIKRS